MSGSHGWQCIVWDKWRTMVMEHFVDPYFMPEDSACLRTYDSSVIVYVCVSMCWGILLRFVCVCLGMWNTACLSFNHKSRNARNNPHQYTSEQSKKWCIFCVYFRAKILRFTAETKRSYPLTLRRIERGRDREWKRERGRDRERERR